MSGGFVERFFDDFNDGALTGWTVDTPVGSVSEAGSALRITVAGNADWWEPGTRQSPVVYRTLASLSLTDKPVRVEACFGACDLPGEGHDVGPQLWKDDDHYYLTGWETPGGPPSGARHLAIDIANRLDDYSAFDATLLGRRTVLYHNPAASVVDMVASEDGRVIAPGQSAFYWSTDGVTYHYLAGDTPTWVPTLVGLYHKNFTDHPAGWVEFDWISVEEWVIDNSSDGGSIAEVYER